MQNQSASLPHYSSYFLKHIVDWKYQNGLGNIILRNLISDRNALNKRKVVVMGESWDGFVGTFSAFPKYISENANKMVLISTIPAEDLIISQDFSCEKKIENNSLLIKPTEENVSVNIEIPPMKDYKHCMIRLIFPVCSATVHTALLDYDSNQLDRVSLTIGNDIKNDLFIPASSETQKVSVLINTSNTSTFCFSISRIEIWGF